MIRIFWLGGILLLLVGCQLSTSERQDPSVKTVDEDLMITPVKDIHSFAKPEQAIMQHLSWKAEIDFDSNRIEAKASIKVLHDPTAEKIILDTKDLEILKVTVDSAGKEVPTNFKLGKPDEVLGQAMSIKLSNNSEWVHVYYRTSREAEALQWLSSEQTTGKNHPFLFTQSQAILARSWIPLQDSPGIRFTYDAEVKVPTDLLALMSAVNPQQKNDQGLYNFVMNQPIPGYLMALAVGDLAFEELGPRSGVFAEPEVLAKAAAEFEDLESMIDAAETLYGPYKWERYDLLVLPPSFPFGGMENPRLTFATPTILAGDKSLTSLVAHELAHSWSGNLVTNATWEDFWLNEGFTVYFEYRIMEALYGADYAEMLAQLSFQDLQSEVEELINNGAARDTHLKLNLKNRNPDDGMTAIAYDKGYFFLKWLEHKAGREIWDEFLNTYFQKHAFESITTERFLDYLQKNLIEAHHINIYSDDRESGVFKDGLPDDLPQPNSPKFKMVQAQLDNWVETGTIPTQTESWSTHEWLHFIKNIPDSTDSTGLSQLDKAFTLSQSGNAEILAAWFTQAIRADYEPAYGPLEEFLVRVGRRKFLMPLYRALVATPRGKERAQRIYAQARANYHFVSTQSLDPILEYQP